MQNIKFENKALTGYDNKGLEPIYSEAEVAEYLGCSKSTMIRERNAGNISFRRVGSKVVYTRQDVQSYLMRDRTKRV